LAPEPLGHPGAEASAPGGRRRRRGVPVLRQQLAPHRDVPVLHLRELAVDAGPVGIALQPGELPVQERGVGLILEVMQPRAHRVG